MLSARTILCFISLSLLWAAQVTAAAYMLGQFWFFQRPVSAAVLPEYALQLAPQINLPLYLTFIMTAAVVYAGALTVWRLSGAPSHVWQRLWKYEAVLAAVTVTMVGAAYQTIIYDNSPQLARIVFWLCGAVSIAGTIFWREVTAGVRSVVPLAGRALASPHGLSADVGMAAGIVMLVYVPDTRGMLALMFIGEQLHHMDFFAMAPGWAAANAMAPYADVMSQYGLGMPVLLARLAEWCGGFNYPTVMRVLIAGGTLYFVVLYFFLKAWWNSRAWALAGTVASFGFMMLHFGVSPVVWIYPSTTPWRLCGDLVVFMLLLSDLRRPHAVKAAAAGIWTGFAAYLMTSTGTALGAAYAVYLLWRTWIAGRGDIGQAVGLLLLPAASFFLCVLVTAKGRAFDLLFWQHMIEYIRYFSSIHAGGVLPIYESLKYRNYGGFLVGMAISILYLSVLLYFLSCWGRRVRHTELVLPVVLAVYGLMSYTYFVVRSAQTSYCPVSLAAVWIVGWLCRTGAGWLSKEQGTRMQWLLLGWVVFMVVTNHNYMAYPNVLNVTGNPFTDKRVIQRFPDRQGYYHHQVKRILDEKKLPLNSVGERDERILTEDDFSSDAALRAYFDAEFNFGRDAAMIQALVPKRDGAAVISSFETSFLIQSGRKPFFYHTPLIASQPMRMRTLPGDSAHSPHFVEETIAQLKARPPAYVFVENILLTEPMPAAIRETSPKIMAIIDAIQEQGYRVVQRGQYLSALTKGK